MKESSCQTQANLFLLNRVPVALVDADVVRGERGDVGVELEDDAPPPRVVVVLGRRELDSSGGAGRVEAQGALVRVQRVRVESGDERQI